MNFKRASGTLGFAVIAAITSPFAMAQEAPGWDHGWYIGGNVGESRAKIDEARIRSNLLGSGFTTSSFNKDERDIGYKLFAGYQLNRYFALEGGYFDLGKFSFTDNTQPLGALNGRLKLRGGNIDLVGMLPITENFSAFARVGANYAEVKDNFSGSGAVNVVNPSPSKKATNVKYGLGLQYAFNYNWAMRGEVERYRIDDAVGNKGDIDLISLGLIYRFGTAKAPPQRVWAPEPVVVVPPPEPAPVIVAPPPPPAAAVAPMPVRLMQVQFSADSLFDFDKSTMKPAGKQHLDKFVSELRGTNYANVIVTGHADRLGSKAYNKKLSKRRAESVKTYLVESGGLPADKVRTGEVDESQPVTKPGECVGKKPTKKLIACLAPDRRVEVEVTGTK